MSRGMGAVLCTRVLGDGGDAVPPEDHSGRGTVPCARYSCRPRGRGRSQTTIVGGARSSVPVYLAAHAAGRGAVLCNRGFGDGEDAVSPGEDHGRGTVPCARILADRGDAVPPRRPSWVRHGPLWPFVWRRMPPFEGRRPRRLKTMGGRRPAGMGAVSAPMFLRMARTPSLPGII
jgi:hypothetical protein